ncbi:MAG TPA: hypothetical protein VIU64_18895, partial [Polyangia bacterium]
MKTKQHTLSLSALGIPLLAVLALAGLGGAGCATTRYGYRPSAVNASNEAGLPAARYAIPAQSPQGEAFVTSFGTRQVDEQGRGSVQLVHVRLAVANQSSPTPWNVDPSSLLLRRAGGPATAGQKPDYMEIDGRQNSGTEIAQGQRRVFDLYYRMPPGSAETSTPPAFDFAWQVNLGSTVFAEDTPFTREPYDEYERQSDRYVTVGVMPPWWWGWYGPLWWGPGYWGYYGYGYRPYIGYGHRGYWG